jgi:hypothetical protein
MKFKVIWGINAMNDLTIGIDQTEQTLLAHEVSDEALEAAAGTGNEIAKAYTLYACTFLGLCPGP